MTKWHMKEMPDTKWRHHCAPIWSLDDKSTRGKKQGRQPFHSIPGVYIYLINKPPPLPLFENHFCLCIIQSEVCNATEILWHYIQGHHLLDPSADLHLSNKKRNHSYHILNLLFSGFFRFNNLLSPEVKHVLFAELWKINDLRGRGIMIFFWIWITQ